MNKPDDGCDLRWDTYLVVFTHAVLIVILFGVVYFLVPPPRPLVPEEFGGALPLSASLLIHTGVLWQHPVIMSFLAIGFLVLDGWAYSSLCRSRGKRAGTIWAASVTAAIVLAIAWYAVLGRLLLNDLVRWRIK